ncbi:hypothetical protein PI124_g22417 [Phytophthora idaei]|nr:hypothetical protein PI124_g22417 [Phytophthora idaei]
MEDVESVEGNADARVAVAANDVNVMADGFEVYIGKRDTADTDQQAFDNKPEAAAVIRNMKAVLDERPQGFRFV